MSKLQDKLRKATNNKLSATLEKSKFFNEKDLIRTRVPILNLALSGKLDGGIVPGLTMLAGPSKHFKSNLGLVMVSAYMREHKDAICLFFDNEFGSTPEYFGAMGVPTDRVEHIPFKNVEELKFQMVNALEEIDRGEKVIIMIDSIGNVASKKEVEDAKAEKSVGDMTRAKQIKSLFRMVTPYLTMLDIPCIGINHTYETQEMYSKTVMSGGTGPMYSADTVIIIGRQQEKDGKEIVGYNFILNIEKSRYVKEKSKLPLNVMFEGGINTYSGLLDLAVELGYVHKPSNGWFQRAFLDTESGELVVAEDEKKMRRAETDNVDFWKPLFAHEPFKQAATSRYKLGCIATTEETLEEVNELFS